MSYMPKHLPRESKWPTIVMETGYRKLDWNARWWLNEFEGEVKMVFVTCIQRQTREYLLQRWGYEMVLSGPGPDQSVYVSSTDEPLVLRFEDVFARQPGEGEEDIILCLDDLKMLARDVWHLEFSDSFE
ncbi:hypothetical protein DPV78_008784 [Talaromyces pinophilus]|nr:hypothetical protein DPV78_008784 [Talaromyces pinophilus]